VTHALSLVHVDAHNLIAHVSGAMTLTSLARALDAQGFVLPLARPLPRMTLARAAVALPFVVDALVQQAGGTAPSGAPFETVAAPRAAIGPSLIHALSTRPPLLVLERARVRVGQRARVKVLVAELSSAADAAALVVEAADEARALAVEAVGSRVVALVPAGTRSLLSRWDTAPRFAHLRRGFLSSTLSIGPADQLAMERALTRGDRVLCAPFMGRAAIGLRAHVRPQSASLHEGVEALARALARVRNADPTTEAM
jgi:hypothetical protein